MMSPEDWAVSMASALPSPATPRKPAPALPARAASMVALSASSLVWSATPLISFVSPPTRCRLSPRARAPRSAAADCSTTPDVILFVTSTRSSTAPAVWRTTSTCAISDSSSPTTALAASSMITWARLRTSCSAARGRPPGGPGGRGPVGGAGDRRRQRVGGGGGVRQHGQALQKIRAGRRLARGLEVALDRPAGSGDLPGIHRQPGDESRGVGAVEGRRRLCAGQQEPRDLHHLNVHQIEAVQVGVEYQLRAGTGTADQP